MTQLHDVLLSVLSHAYARATSNALPLRTTREDGRGGGGGGDLSVGVCVNGCGRSACVSVVLPCAHISCWDCLGGCMRDKEGSCRQCGAASTWQSTGDAAFVLDENEALLLSSQYLLSSYSLPAHSPVLSPLLYPHPSPSPVVRLRQHAVVRVVHVPVVQEAEVVVVVPRTGVLVALVAQPSDSASVVRLHPPRVGFARKCGVRLRVPSPAAADPQPRRLRQSPCTRPPTSAVAPGVPSSPARPRGPTAEAARGGGAGGVPAFSLSAIPPSGTSSHHQPPLHPLSSPLPPARASPEHHHHRSAPQGADALPVSPSSLRLSE